MCEDYDEERMEAFWRALAEAHARRKPEDPVGAPVVTSLGPFAETAGRPKAPAFVRRSSESRPPQRKNR